MLVRIVTKNKNSFFKKEKAFIKNTALLACASDSASYRLMLDIPNNNEDMTWSKL